MSGERLPERVFEDLCVYNRQEEEFRKWRRELDAQERRVVEGLAPLVLSIFTDLVSASIDLDGKVPEGRVLNLLEHRFSASIPRDFWREALKHLVREKKLMQEDFYDSRLDLYRSYWLPLV